MAGAWGKEPACHSRDEETHVEALGGEEALEEGTATRPSVLAWRVPGTEEPGGARVRGVSERQTRLSDSARVQAFCRWDGKVGVASLSPTHGPWVCTQAGRACATGRQAPGACGPLTATQDLVSPQLVLSARTCPQGV